MDTYKRIPIGSFDDFFDSIECEQIPEKDVDIICRYEREFEALIELEQLFQVFVVNVDLLSSKCDLRYDDCVYDKETMQEADPILVNALFNNMISAGKVLVERIEVVLENDMSVKMKEEYKKRYLSKIYDGEFAYRFFCFLRNMSQHGTLVVSCQDGKYLFDLYQLSKMKHIKKKQEMMNELNGYIETIKKEYNDEAHLCFTRMVDLYVRSIYKLYYYFLLLIESEISATGVAFSSMVESNPSYICQKEPFKGHIIYEIEDSTAHVISAHEMLIGVYRGYSENIASKLHEYESMNPQSELKVIQDK